jgi:hypothetical protein
MRIYFYFCFVSIIVRTISLFEPNAGFAIHLRTKTNSTQSLGRKDLDDTVKHLTKITGAQKCLSIKDQH